MDGILPLVQTYGPWLLLGGGLVLVLRHGGMSRCGLPQQADGRPRSAPAKATGAEPGASVMTVDDLQARLAEARARHEILARQIAALEAAPAPSAPPAPARPRDGAITAPVAREREA